jgi:hypothetical protein
MGPTGVRTKIPTHHETILIIGNASSFAFLRSYGNACRKAGNRVFYLGLFNTKDEVYCQEKIENVTDAITWVTKNGETISSNRHQDRSLAGDDIIKALTDPTLNLPLAEVDRIFIIGETDLLKRFQGARQSQLNPVLSKNPKVYGSVYGNMQCMLKGVCAQCLQWQIDPETGQRTKAVFTCSWQDQPLEIIDIDHINARQWQNRLQEQLNNLWVDYLFETQPIDRI